MNDKPDNAERVAASTDNWRFELDDNNIGWLCLDKHESSTNVLSRAVVLEFEQIVQALQQSPPAGLVLFSGKDSDFILGADINEFPALKNATQAYDLIRRSHDILMQFEALPCTTVAMIDGLALGGGLELALACDCRVVANENRSTLGLPEVQLGLHPGFGGTVRAVQICGVRPAMQLMLTGNPVTAARRSGVRTWGVPTKQVSASTGT